MINVRDVHCTRNIETNMRDRIRDITSYKSVNIRLKVFYKREIQQNKRRHQYLLFLFTWRVVCDNFGMLKRLSTLCDNKHRQNVTWVFSRK